MKREWQVSVGARPGIHLNKRKKERKKSGLEQIGIFPVPPGAFIFPPGPWHELR
jgi:hypothetical protein